MINWLARIFIKDYQNYQDNKVREEYGVLISVISILLNLLLVIIKLFIGLLANSIAIMIDGFNNLSDIGSNVASLLGFKLGNKHPDKEHPNGHGRYEYIASFIISFIILLVGFQALMQAVNAIIKPDKIIFSWFVVLALIISILIKLLMTIFNKQTGKLINSDALLAASKDSFNDIIATTATLLVICLSPITKLPLDGIFGIVVALYIIKSGYELFLDTLSPLLGNSGNLEVIRQIEALLEGDPNVLGTHDLRIHDYGVGRKFLTVHCEVNAKNDFLMTHDAIDNLEKEIFNRFNYETTIHFDPIIIDDPETTQLHDYVVQLIKKIDVDYRVNDFRVVKGITHYNLVYNVEIPIDDTIEHSKLIDLINSKIKNDHPNYNSVIEITHWIT